MLRATAEAVGGKGAKLTWHLHPPMLRALGMKNKLKLGRWATPMFMALRAGRHLRGTPFDVAGWSRLRRIEKKLPVEYAAMMKRLVRESTADDVVLEIANLPDIIRGYEHIKLANIAAYRERLGQLLKVA